MWLATPAIIALYQPPPPAAAPRKPPATLATALEKLHWDPATRGPLLLVGADRLLPGGNLLPLRPDEDDVPPGPPGSGDLPEPTRGTFTLEGLATLFRCRIVRAGGVATLAPLDRLDYAGLMAREIERTMDSMLGQGDENLLILLASLTPGQWSQLGTPGGLGRESLSAAQAPIWERLLPPIAEFQFPAGRRPPPRRQPTVEEMIRLRSGEPPSPELRALLTPPTLTPAQVGSLRIRLKQVLGVSAFYAKASDEDEGFDVGTAEEKPSTGSETDTIAVRPVSGMMDSPFEQLAPPRTVIQARTSQLDFQAGALSVAVALDGAETVGQLVERIARATGVPLVTDRRYAGVAVRTWGASARAGDLLQALTRALDGAVRKLGEGDDSLYLLTDDAMPSARRNASLGERILSLMGPLAVRRKSVVREAARARARLRDAKPLGRVPREPSSLPETFWTAAQNGEKGFSVALTSLPEGYQKQVRTLWDQMDLETRSTRLPPDRARPKLTLVAELVLPDSGAFASLSSLDAGQLAVEASPAPTVEPIAWPAALKLRGAFVAAPAGDDERATLIETAVSRGLTHLFVRADTAAERAAIGPLAAAAKAKGLGTVPVVAPLFGASGPDWLPRDVSARGETVRQWASGRTAKAMAQSLPMVSQWVDRFSASDFVVPEVIDPAEVARSLERLAELPGVTHVALRALTTPGYSGESDGVDEFLWGGGVTLGARLNFVRGQQIDPADLGELELGFGFGGGGASLADPQALRGAQTAWRKQQQTRRDGLLTRLDTALRRASIKLPVLFTDAEPPTPEPTLRWESWSGKPLARLDEAEETPRKGPRPAVRLRAIDPLEQAMEDLNEDDIDAPHLLSTDAERFLAWLKVKIDETAPEPDPKKKPEPPAWDGIVLDLSDLPLTKAIALLDASLAPVKKAQK